MTMFFLIFSVSVFSEDLPLNINTQVKSIEAQKGDLDSLNLTVQSSELENSAPQVAYYYESENNTLRLARITSSKGIFLVVYSYYFKDGEPLKYLVEYIDHPDNLPKQAIIYSDGKVIWSNVEVPVQEPHFILESFNASLENITRFR
ncbi:hypothetical protein [Vibrio nigripulchritudo]|uniref:hypothetical protein n=1 Tax=Vibrio nigripulchritudo TaxID=28173 RepID=UPI00190BFAE4|nr:hypothetical protein [Vibrio nigripulchritudo]